MYLKSGKVRFPLYVLCFLEDAVEARVCVCDFLLLLKCSIFSLSSTSVCVCVCVFQTMPSASTVTQTEHCTLAIRTQSAAFTNKQMF